jgi:uncharacterized protein
MSTGSTGTANSLKHTGRSVPIEQNQAIMSCNRRGPYSRFRQELSRREVIKASAIGAALLALPRDLLAASKGNPSFQEAADRFPHFRSWPVSFLAVRMQDRFWAPRQKTTREISVPWITSWQDKAGGLVEFRKDPQHYKTRVAIGEFEHIKFIEAMASVVGVQPDRSICGLIDVWAKQLMEAQGDDGYLAAHWPIGHSRPPQRWQPIGWSHEDYAIGHYLEAAIAYREVTGSDAMYRSAVRAADHMAGELLDGRRAYAPPHPEIEQALMRLYGLTGDTKYLRLCGWLLDQRGRHNGRPSYGPLHQDDLPIKDQRAIVGHAVRAGYLYNGVTQFVGATGDAEYREAVLAIWDDFANHKMFIHGGGGNQSAKGEGYLAEPYKIRPDDAYCESCSVFANFQWAHSLFHLTGQARYIDTAERMLYNAFYASLSLAGDSSFYCNVLQTPNLASPSEMRDMPPLPAQRAASLATSCCPPNIVKLFNKVGGFFYSTDRDGIFIKHYGACEAHIPWSSGIRILQETDYPWNGTIVVTVEPKRPEECTLRFRLPAWSKSHKVSINGRSLDIVPEDGWLPVRRRWVSGDQVTLEFVMEVERVTLPKQFAGYRNRAALQRGPIVYCLEEQDVEAPPGNDEWARANQFSARTSIVQSLFIPETARFTAEHRSDFLGGVTVLHGEVMRRSDWDESSRPVRVMFIPYGVWGNRKRDPMRVWLGARSSAFISAMYCDHRDMSCD